MTLWWCKSVRDGSAICHHKAFPAPSIRGQSQSHIWKGEWELIVMNLATLDPLSAEAGLPLCNQDHVNLNLQTPVVSHFVLWFWHTRKMWLDGHLIQTRNSSQATTCLSSTKSELGVTNLFSKWPPATTHSKWEDFHQQNWLGVSISSVPYAEAVPKILHRGGTGAWP